jgi:selenocysteine lyase/cysteine desulfurase
VSDKQLECQRHRFAIPDDVTYLNCAYISPLMDTVRQAIRSGMALEARPWRITSNEFFAPVEKARSLFAQLIDATSDDIAIVPATSYGIATAALNLPVSAGQEIILLQDQYPSNVYSWRELAKNKDIRLTIVERPGDGNWTPAVLAAINDKTAFATLPNCHWMDGALLDLAVIRDRLNEVGAGFVLDASQSLGALPLGVQALQPDFLVCSGYKWLLCPYTVSFLYVHPKWHSGLALEQSPHNRINGPDFPRMHIPTDEYAAGARRFDMGERAHFTLLPGAIAALEQLIEWRPEHIAQYTGALTNDINHRARNLGLQTLPDALRANHFGGVRFRDEMPDGLITALREQKIYVSQRGESLRVTPNVYNDTGDIDRLFGVLEHYIS